MDQYNVESSDSKSTYSVTRATSTLRIYLTCAVQETQDLLVKYTPRAAAEKSVAFSHSWDNNHWHHVVALLGKLQHYIENCAVSGDAELCYGLSAIGAVWAN